VFGPDNYEDIPEEFATQEEAEAIAQTLGGSGFHSHTDEQGITIYMPFETHEEYELKLSMAKSEDADFGPGLKMKIQERLTQLVEGSYTNNSL
jgi:hypothetical protein